jgi:hypothetical protein
MPTDTSEETKSPLAPAQGWSGRDAKFVIPEVIPDIAIDGFEGAIGVNGIIRINLVRFRGNPGTSEIVREVVSTLSMSSATANSFLSAFATALAQHGMLGDNVSVMAAPPQTTGIKAD